MLKGTSDLFFAAFLKLEGYKVADYEIIHKNKGKFFFDLSNEEWKLMKIKCDNSEVSKIKTALTSLKDLLF